jgi:hypothetical protein
MFGRKVGLRFLRRFVMFCALMRVVLSVVRFRR